MYTEVKIAWKVLWILKRAHTENNIQKKKIKLSTKGQHKLYENTKICNICKEKYENKYVKCKIYCKVWDHCHYAREYRGAAHIICN